VTIVIPTHNYARYVGQAIDSGLNQRYRPIEVIVVDDGSTDETPALLRSFEATIRILRLDGRGVSAARNAGLAQARGEYVVLLDADDLLLPDGVAAQVGLFAQRPDADAVAGGWYACDVELGTVTRGRSSLKDGDVLPQLLRSNIVATPSVMMLRRAALEAVGGFDTSLSFNADWEMWLRLAKHGCRFAQVAAVAMYRIHGRSMTMNLDRAIGDMTALFERYLNDPMLSEEMRAFGAQTRFGSMTYLSRLCLRQGDDQRGRECLRQALRWNPDALNTLTFYLRLADAMSRQARLGRRDVASVTKAMLTLSEELDDGWDEGRRRRQALRHLAAGMIARNADDWRRGLQHLKAATGESWRTVLRVPHLASIFRLLLPRWLTRSARRASPLSGSTPRPNPKCLRVCGQR
jgi:GT2 family glycosyltransferase